MNNDGRKIYNSERERRRKQRQIRGFLSLIFTVTIVFGIFVLGFNIAKPVFKHFSSDDNDSYEMQNTETSAAYQVIDTESGKETENSGYNTDVTETTPADVTEVSVSDSDNISDEVYETSETEYMSLEPSVNETTAPEGSQNSESLYKSAYHLQSEDFETISNLKSALSKAVHQSGCTTVIVPLKQTGGYLYYASEVNGTEHCTASQNVLTLSEITSAIKAEGLVPVAEVSTLYDNIYPQIYTVASYKFADDNSTSWWDNSQEKGGKPWLCPFSEYSKNYLASLAAEISAAGFSEIICTDFVFPEFRDSDVEILGTYVVEHDRYKALLEVAYAMKESAGNAELSVSFSAYDAIKGNAEVLAPSEMSGLSVTPYIDLSSFGSSVSNFRGESFDLSGNTFNKVVGVVEALESVCDGLDMTPCFKKESLSEDDFQQVIKAVKTLGYDICYFY
ncbi:MAG: putative glycoside hydrolase [Oscillospiraceae bacterium]